MSVDQGSWYRQPSRHLSSATRRSSKLEGVGATSYTILRQGSGFARLMEGGREPKVEIPVKEYVFMMRNPPCLNI